MDKSKEHSIEQDQSLDNSSHPQQHSISQVNIKYLPGEMMLKIFQFLPPSDLKSAVLVCKTWSEIGGESRLWTWVVVTVYTEQDFGKLNIQRLQMLQEIKVTHGFYLSKLFRVINGIPTVRRISGLESVYFAISEVEPDLFVSVLSRLEELRLYQHLTTPEQFEQLLIAISGKTNLKFLELYCETALGLSLSIEIDPELFAAAVSNVVKVNLEGSFISRQLMALFKAIIAKDRPLKKLNVSASLAPIMDPDIMGSALNMLEEVTISYFVDGGHQRRAITSILRKLVDGESRLKRLMLAKIYDSDFIDGLDQDLVRRAKRKVGEFHTNQ